MRSALLLFGLLLVAPAYAWSQQSLDARCTQPGETSCIDWNAGIAIALGTGAPAAWAKNAAQKNISASRAARLDAARNLLELIKGINVSSSTTMQQAMVSNDTVQTQIEGKLHSIRMVGQPKYFSDGSIRVKLETALREIIPQDLVLGISAGPPRLLEAPSSQPLRGGAPGGGLNPQQSYTGLVIDARGTGVVPALSPKVFDQQGREVYGSAFVSREFAISQGMVGYVKTVEAAVKTDRVAGNPAVIKAIEAKGANQSDLVISQKDADSLRAIAQTQKFLQESRVMVVLD